jgi:hypothetical protein
VDTQQGGERCIASAGIGSGARLYLQGIVFSQDRSFGKDFVHLLRMMIVMQGKPSVRAIRSARMNEALKTRFGW